MTDARGRTARHEEVRQERRRRDDVTLDGGQAKKMAIPRDVAKTLADQGRSARWVHDTGTRLHDLTVLDDWDRVEGVEPRTVIIDRKNGETAQAILVSKRNDFIAEDRAKKEARRREQEDAMLKGRIAGDPNPLPSEVSYADAMRDNKIERGFSNI